MNYPSYDPDTGVFQVHPCPLCHKPCERPLVRPDEPVVAGLTFVEGFGLVHPECAVALSEGRLQAKMEMEDVA